MFGKKSKSERNVLSFVLKALKPDNAIATVILFMPNAVSNVSLSRDFTLKLILIIPYW